jgi:CheY-like chemotaxis protein
MSRAVGAPLMIIDDDDDLRGALAFIMTEQGYDVREFGDARLALRALEEGAAPFLILLDLMMAGMSGWEFRAAQIQHSRLAAIPVVVLTAANTLEDGEFELTNVDVIEKPFSLDTLLTVVAKYAATAV